MKGGQTCKNRQLIILTRRQGRHDHEKTQTATENKAGRAVSTIHSPPAMFPISLSAPSLSTVVRLVCLCFTHLHRHH